MTLRAVIESLLRGSDDAEAVLADNGFGDLPADMFSQALASYSDTAPMAEADALTPILTSLEASDPSDVFAVLEEQPLVVGGEPSPADLAMVGAAISGVDVVDAALDDTALDDTALDDSTGLDDDLADFGASAAESTTPSAEEPVVEVETDVDDQLSDTGLELPEQDPFADDDFASGDGEADSFEDLFQSEPEATGDDPSDLDLDF